MAQPPGPTAWPTRLAVCALACLVAVVFYPVVGFEFIESDVLGQVVHNPYVRGLTAENVKHILTSRCLTSYYPVRTLTYALDYQVWGLHAGGFKLTGGLIHLANVILVFWLILRILRHEVRDGRSPHPWWETSAAAFAAGAFAVHPVVVEPVVWVAGREELLMTLGALGSIHFHLSARRRGRLLRGRLPEQRRGCGDPLAHHGVGPAHARAAESLEDRSGHGSPSPPGAAAVSCGACLSNAVGAAIPLLITAWDLLTLERPKAWKIVLGTAPLWAIALTAVLLKGFGHESVLAREVGLLAPQRLMLVLNVYWLNVKTLVWPTDLSLSYALLRPESSFERAVILGAVAASLTCLAIWALRRRTLVLFGLLWFVLALGPTSQIMPHHVHRADRFLYLPLVGLAVALGASLGRLGNVSKSRLVPAGVIAIAGACFVILGALGAYQVETWRDSVSLWAKCVVADPENPVPHRVLADSLSKRGRWGEAFPHYQRAIEIEPDYVDAFGNYAFYLLACDDETQRDDQLAIELAERGCGLTGRRDPNLLRTLAMACTSRGAALARGGLHRQAMTLYDRAIEADPGYEMAYFNLALLLATCADEELRDAERAVRLAERACRSIDRPDSARLGILAAAYAAAGRFEDAVTTAEKALELAEASAVESADELRRQLRLYRNGLPYRPRP